MIIFLKLKQHPDASRPLYVDVADMLAIEAGVGFTTIHLRAGKTFRVADTVGEVFDQWKTKNAEAAKMMERPQ